MPSESPAPLISSVPYLPGLDGLRAVAVVAVMAYHANHDWLGGGFLGVEVFFVISGYLITLLLIAEHERSGHVRLGRFWLRRARRLLPALAVMLAGLAVYVALFFRRAQGRVRGDLLAGMGYVSNWYQIWVGQGYTQSEAFAPLRHLWSLAVEEQFYLVWPLVMVVILRRGRDRLPNVAAVLVGVSVAITVAIAVLYAPGDVAATCAEGSHGYWTVAGRCVSVNDALYLSTVTRAGGLMLGAAFAMVWRPLALMRGPMRHRGRQLDAVAVVGLAALAWLTWHTQLSTVGTKLGSRFDPWLYRGGFLLVGVATLLVIAAVTHQRSVMGAALGNPLLRWIGTRSYGLYLFHWPIYQIIRKEAGIGLTGSQFVAAMALTLPVTEASYRFVELPVRQGRFGAWVGRARRGFADPARRRALVGASACAAVAVAFAAASIALAPDRCVGTVECSLAAAASAPETTASVPSTSASSTPPTSAPQSTTTSTTTTIPVAQRQPLAIGESVMEGAAPALRQAGFRVDAAQSRQGKQALAALQAHKAANEIGDTVVIQIGTNGDVSQQTFDDMLAELDGVSNVWFLTVTGSKPWVAPNNDRIHALQGRAQVLEWAANAATQPDLFVSDGVHLRNAAGYRYYANLILGALGRPLLAG
jgi:peptidoglycan/LPS O-acetylase OafA/YrhL